VSKRVRGMREGFGVPVSHLRWCCPMRTFREEGEGAGWKEQLLFADWQSFDDDLVQRRKRKKAYDPLQHYW